MSIYTHTYRREAHRRVVVVIFDVDDVDNGKIGEDDSAAAAVQSAGYHYHAKADKTEWPSTSFCRTCTTPGHNTCRFMRGVQNHVYEGQTASRCDPHSPGGLVGWTRAFCKPPRKKMALGKANFPQPITIQLPPPAGRVQGRRLAGLSGDPLRSFEILAPIE